MCEFCFPCFLKILICLIFPGFSPQNSQKKHPNEHQKNLALGSETLSTFSEATTTDPLTPPVAD